MVPVNSQIQMESNQDLATLALQIQTLAASVEELTRQNQEIRLWLQQEENRSRINQEDEGDSHRRSDCRGPTTPDEPNSKLLWVLRKEMDELRMPLKGRQIEAWIEWLG